MRSTYAAVMLLAFVVCAPAAADRRWQTGTCTQVGINRTPFVADVVRERMPPPYNKPTLTEVAEYVIETDDRRFNLQAMVAIGSDAFATQLTPGDRVMFAVEKRTAYIRLETGEYRLLVVKNEAKKKP